MTHTRGRVAARRSIFLSSSSSSSTPCGDTPCGDTPCGDTLCGDTFCGDTCLAIEAAWPRLPKSGLWTSVFFSEPTFSQHNLRLRHPRHGQSSFTAQGLSAASKPSRSWRRWHDDNARDSSQMPSHSMAVQSSPQLHSPDQSTTWRGISGAVVRDALATCRVELRSATHCRVELWSATHWPPLFPQAHRRSCAAEGPAQRGHLLTGVGARKQAVGNARVATPGSVSRLDTAGVQNVRAPAREPRKKQDSKSFALACAFLRPPVWPSVSCVSCFPFSGAVLCPCLPFCAGRWVVSTVRVFPSLCFTGADPRTEP